MLTEDGGDHILYLLNLYYCMESVLKDFTTLIDGQLLYYNTDSDQLDRESRKILFDKLGIPGTQCNSSQKWIGFDSWQCSRCPSYLSGNF